MTPIPGPSRLGWTAADDWPRTTRVLPWLLAAFVTMLWLVPFDGVELRIPMPIDPKLDRIALGFVIVIWLVALLSEEQLRPRLRQPTRVDLAIGVFLLAAVGSVLVNLDRIALHDELHFATKKLGLLFAFAAFFLIVSTTIRASELRSYMILTVGLGVLTSIGIIVEYRLRLNFFFDWTRQLAPPGISVGREVGDSKFGRPAVTGPTGHGLAATTILAMAAPFALVLFMEAKRWRARILFALAATIILAGTVSTLRKTAVLAVAAGLLVLLLYRPRVMVRLLPFGVIMIIGIQGLTPGALGSIRAQLRPDRLENAATTEGRTADYDAVRPDLRAHPVLGRGYGTYDSHKYRLLDNQYLATLLQTGYLGFAAFLAVWLATIGTAHAAARSRDPARGPPALAAAAAAAAFGVSAALFDVMAFPHVPYQFFFAAALGVVAAQAHRAPAKERARTPLAAVRPPVPATSS